MASPSGRHNDSTACSRRNLRLTRYCANMRRGALNTRMNPLGNVATRKNTDENVE